MAEQNQGLDFVPVEKWGKDHWSTFAYAESRAVDYKGQLDKRHMRCNRDRHPTHVHGGTTGNMPPTRLHGYFDDKENPALRVDGHDDWDCLLDAEQAGFLTISLGSNVVRFTELGAKVAGELRFHKASGKPFGAFVWGGE